MKLSYSRIKCFKDCKYKYYLKYILKEKGTQNFAHLTKGKRVHSLLEYHGSQSDVTDPIAISIYERFRDSEIGKDILSPKSLREYKINMDSGLNPKNESSDFVGYIDRINFKNDKFELIDFKTGKYPEKQDFSQLMYYGVWFLQRFPESQNVKLRYVYVEHLNEHSAIFDRKNLELIKTSFLSDIKSIENCEDFTKNPTPLCNWCEFCDLCKF